jgi:indole-3-glycerol phosphate synthase
MSFLGEILARKRLEVQERRRAVKDAVLESRLGTLRDPERWYRALAANGERSPVRLIAEVKRASPSRGALNRQLDPATLARTYADAGAAAISVLTDGEGFGGSLADLAAVRAAVALPLIRKDFMLDRYQLLEACVAGADAVLLIVAALERATLKQLLAQAHELGLGTLVEVHDRDELEVAVEVGSPAIGVNNRDLRTFEVDLATSEALIPRMPKSVRAVAESGIKGPAEIQRLRPCGASNFLVGEALVTAADPSALMRAMREVAE